MEIPEQQPGGQRTADSRPGDRRGSASLVAGGILVSRVLGLARQASLGYFFGAAAHADVFTTALRGPNLIQNLLGEQSLSASFIPVYSRLLREGKREEAGRFAGAIFGLLLAAAGVLTLVGVLFAEQLVTVFSAGYLADAGQVAAGLETVDRFPLAVRAVRITCPMTGVLVLSAWSLGVLNSHRRFFLPYFAPALWNAAIIAALFTAANFSTAAGEAQGGMTALDRLLIAACLGALVGGGLQFAVQLPLVARLMRGFSISLSTRVKGVSEALRSFMPLLASRGVVQLSSYLDLQLSSFLVAGAQGAIGWAQQLYLLPVSLFGMSIAASELPELSRLKLEDGAEAFSRRLDRGLRRMAYLTVPTGVGFLIFGFLLVGGIYRRGRFGVDANWLVYLILCGYTLGLLASATSRILNNLFYALGRTRVPARIAIERVTISAVLGMGLMLLLDRIPVASTFRVEVSQEPLYLGALGLALGAGIASWYEFWRVRRAVGGVLEGFRLPLRQYVVMAAVAAVAAFPAGLAWLALRSLPLAATAIMVVGIYAAVYLALTHRLGVSEADHWFGALLRRVRRKS